MLSIPWVLRMNWLELCFLNWPLSPEALAHTLPAGLELDLYQSNRLCFYGAAASQLFRGWVAHRPWPLQKARAELAVNTLAEPLGIRLQAAPYALYAHQCGGPSLVAGAGARHAIKNPLFRAVI